MQRTPLWLPFCLAFLFTLIETALFPSVRLWPFAPFLALAAYRFSLKKTLWMSFLAGCIMDLATSQFRFGLLSLVHCSTLFLMHGQKKHFFEDKPLGFSCYSALISAGLSLCLILFSSFLEKQVSFSFSLIASDVLLVSLLDAAYAYVWFVGPIFLYAIIKKRGLKGLFTSVQKEES